MKRAFPLALLLLAGCVYYNGMYNANRLVKRAHKAERDGRTFEAQGYWAQAEVRADSVVARYPTSSWADDAQLIRGEAMITRNDCDGAILPLEQASLSRDSPKVAERAQQLLADCRLRQGNLPAADRAFVTLMESPDTSVSNPARFQHATILRINGDYEAALIALQGLEGIGPDDERAASYAGLGEVEQARPLIEAALARGDLHTPWDATLAGIGRVDPGLASQYTSAVAALPGFPPEARDALLDADGLRLLPSNPDSGLARLREAGSANPATDASLVARLHVAEEILWQADTLSALELARQELTDLTQVGGPPSVSAIRYLRVLNRARGYLDSVPPGSPLGDLATFVLAESVRDGLPAPRVAAQLFGAIPAFWPASPYAPKALLALAELQQGEVESIVHTLECVYPDSPYLQLVAGTVTPEVLALEDSLQAYSGGGTPARVPGSRSPTTAPAQRPQDELK